MAIATSVFGPSSRDTAAASYPATPTVAAVPLTATCAAGSETRPATAIFCLETTAPFGGVEIEIVSGVASSVTETVAAASPNSFVAVAVSSLPPSSSGTDAVKTSPAIVAVTPFTVTVSGSEPTTVPVTVIGVASATVPSAGLEIEIVGAVPRVTVAESEPLFPTASTATAAIGLLPTTSETVVENAPPLSATA